MSLESLIPMVNRWLEGVNIAMDDDSLVSKKISNKISHIKSLKNIDNQFFFMYNHIHFLFGNWRKKYFIHTRNTFQKVYFICSVVLI